MICNRQLLIVAVFLDELQSDLVFVLAVSADVVADALLAKAPLRPCTLFLASRQVDIPSFMSNSTRLQSI